MPVHAVLFDLEARIDGRTLKARAQRKVAARETYEEAIERGKTAVLHEEVLRGVHMLSIGHIPPGEEIEVSATWAMTLSNVNGSARLRIPLTVGDIYGRSGLPDSDDLRHGGPVQTGELTVRCRDGQVRLLGGRLIEDKSSIPLNAPIDLDVSGWTPADLRGRAADGREVVLNIAPTPPSNGALDVAVVIDHSGSMGEVCSAEQPRLTKHRAIVAGLEKIANSLGSADVIDLWEFDDGLNHVGVAQGGRSLTALAWQLAGPAGGTEIGRALAGVTAHAKARDVLLVTDGKSYALDVQELARTGRRFAVVLVGEDSLEANVGHLAALSGGDIFVAANAELTDVLEAALRSLRSDHLVTAPLTGKPQRIVVRRAGMTAQPIGGNRLRQPKRPSKAARWPRWPQASPFLRLMKKRQERSQNPRASSPISRAWCWSTKPALFRRACRERARSRCPPRAQASWRAPWDGRVPWPGLRRCRPAMTAWYPHRRRGDSGSCCAGSRPPLLPAAIHHRKKAARPRSTGGLTCPA